MKKYKKILVIFLVLLIIILIAIIKQHMEFSLDEIAAFVDKSDNIPNNIYIKDEMVHEDETEIYEIFAKDNKIHTRYITNGVCSYDRIWNFETKQDIFIGHNTKSISIHQIEGRGKDNPLTQELFSFSRWFKLSIDKYKYLGKEEIEGKEYIKFSLTNKEYSNKEYYYIDIEDKTVSKKEWYTGENVYKSTYTYSYNTVTDKDILEFDINNYPDYKLSEY